MTVGGLAVKVVRKNIKNLHLAVYPPDGLVRIAVPKITDDNAVRLAIISKLGWIKKQITTFENQPRQSAREFVTGESHYYLGRRYLLEVCSDDLPSQPQYRCPSVVLKNKKTLIISVNQGASQAQREKLLTEWYRKQMKKLLPDIIQKWEIKSSLKVQAYGIKRMKTKWGSCNPSQKRIWLNLELIKKPIHCLEYVVVHEMTHFLERTHNKMFIQALTQFMPQWKQYQEELNNTPLQEEKWGAL